MVLYCFPYAGGSADIFHKWKPYVNRSIELRPLELAGRGRRINDPPYNDFYQIIEEILPILIRETQLKDYAFFGHSMGGKIIFELAREIVLQKLPPPRHLFFAGVGAPNVKIKDQKDYLKLSDEEFKEEVIEMGGTPENFFDEPELEKVFLPLLRNDFKLSFMNDFSDEVIAFPCDISVFAGTEEDLTPEQILGWRDFTTGCCSINYFKGGHFFINDHVRLIVSKVNKELSGI
jgi:surfactin synthase thioesterase subunit